MPRRVERLRNESRISRTPSDLLADLHVYILPQDKWIPFRRLARNTVAEETVSAGFVRVLPDVTLVDLRQELEGQLGVDEVPEHYVFIKSVGRNFTQVKPHQEQKVKVKNFLPPHADEPEIHIMELSQEILRYAPSLSNLLASDTELSESMGPSRLTQREVYGRNDTLKSWAESGEMKWEEHHSRNGQYYEEGASASVQGEPPSGMTGIRTTDRYDLDNNIIIHWREEDGINGETRDRGDGMSDNRERRRSAERDDAIEGSTESSEDQERRTTRRSRRSREKRSERGNGKSGERTNEKKKGDGEEGEVQTNGRVTEVSNESVKTRVSKPIHKTNSKVQINKRNKETRKKKDDGNSEESSDKDEVAQMKEKMDIKARRVPGKGKARSDVEEEGKVEIVEQFNEKKVNVQNSMIVNGKVDDSDRLDGGHGEIKVSEGYEEKSEVKTTHHSEVTEEGGEVQTDGKDTKNSDRVTEGGKEDVQIDGKDTKTSDRVTEGGKGEVQIDGKDTKTSDRGADGGKEGDSDPDETGERPAKMRSLTKTRESLVEISKETIVEINRVNGEGSEVKKDGDKETNSQKETENDSKAVEMDNREGAENSAGSLDGTNVGRNIYAKSENGDMVRINLTGGNSGETEENGKREGGDNESDRREGENKQQNSESYEIVFESNSVTEQTTTTNQRTGKTETTNSVGQRRANAGKISTKPGGAIGGGPDVGGADRGRARARRRQAKGSVTDDEGDAKGSGQSGGNKVHISTKFASTEKLTRSVSESRVQDLSSYAENLAGDKDRGPKVKRSASEERLGYDPWLYAPHKWYYARIAKPLTGEEELDFTSSSGEPEDREARRLKALEAKKQASLDDASSDVTRPNVEILSMDGSLGPLTSLQEGVISGFQVNSESFDENSENPLAASRDHLTLTYELEVDEQGSRIKPLTRAPGDGKGAWESEVEEGGSPGSRADGDGEDAAAIEDAEGSRVKKKGRKHSRGMSQEQDEKISSRLAQVLQEKAEAEEKRQRLFNQAKDLHEEILRVKEKRREKWWKQYNDSRKIGTQLEERQAGYRNELDSLHRKIIGSIIRRQPLVTGVRDEPSRKANYKISIIRLRHEVEDLRRRVEAMDIKVEAEVRLRSQAERELKTLRQEVSRKKANMALSQSRASVLRNASSFPPDLLVRM